MGVSTIPMERFKRDTEQTGEKLMTNLPLSAKFTFAISDEMKQRIRKLPRGVQLGVHLRAALGEILDELLPEVIAIEKSSITPIKTEEFKQQLKNRIRTG